MERLLQGETAVIMLAFISHEEEVGPVRHLWMVIESFRPINN